MPGSNNSGPKTKKSKRPAAAAGNGSPNSVNAKVVARFGEKGLTKKNRKELVAKIRGIRANSNLNSSEKRAKEEERLAKVQRALNRVRAEKEAEQAAKAAEKAAAKEAASRARTAATTARREEKERALAKAKENLKEYLGESPMKKYVENLYKKRKNARNMTAKNYAKEVGLRRTAKLSESAKKALAKREKVMKDFKEKGVDGEEFCGDLVALSDIKRRVEQFHKDKALKHSLSTITEVCLKASDVATPGSGSSSANSA